MWTILSALWVIVGVLYLGLAPVLWARRFHFPINGRAISVLLTLAFCMTASAIMLVFQSGLDQPPCFLSSYLLGLFLPFIAYLLLLRCVNLLFQVYIARNLFLLSAQRARQSDWARMYVHNLPDKPVESNQVQLSWCTRHRWLCSPRYVVPFSLLVVAFLTWSSASATSSYSPPYCPALPVPSLIFLLITFLLLFLTLIKPPASDFGIARELRRLLFLILAALLLLLAAFLASWRASAQNALEVMTEYKLFSWAALLVAAGMCILSYVLPLRQSLLPATTPGRSSTKARKFPYHNVQALMQDPAATQVFMKYLVSQFATENMLFLQAVEWYKAEFEELLSMQRAVSQYRISMEKATESPKSPKEKETKNDPGRQHHCVTSHTGTNEKETTTNTPGPPGLPPALRSVTSVATGANEKEINRPPRRRHVVKSAKRAKNSTVTPFSTSAPHLAVQPSWNELLPSDSPFLCSSFSEPVQIDSLSLSQSFATVNFHMVCPDRGAGSDRKAEAPAAAGSHHVSSPLQAVLGQAASRAGQPGPAFSCGPSVSAQGLDLKSQGLSDQGQQQAASALSGEAQFTTPDRAGPAGQPAACPRESTAASAEFSRASAEEPVLAAVPPMAAITRQRSQSDGWGCRREKPLDRTRPRHATSISASCTPTRRNRHIWTNLDVKCHSPFRASPKSTPPLQQTPIGEESEEQEEEDEIEVETEFEVVKMFPSLVLSSADLNSPSTPVLSPPALSKASSAITSTPVLSPPAFCKASSAITSTPVLSPPAFSKASSAITSTPVLSPPAFSKASSAMTSTPVLSPPAFSKASSAMTSPAGLSTADSIFVSPSRSDHEDPNAPPQGTSGKGSPPALAMHPSPPALSPTHSPAATPALSSPTQSPAAMLLHACQQQQQQQPTTSPPSPPVMRMHPSQQQPPSPPQSPTVMVMHPSLPPHASFPLKQQASSPTLYHGNPPVFSKTDRPPNRKSAFRFVRPWPRRPDRATSDSNDPSRAGRPMLGQVGKDVLHYSEPYFVSSSAGPGEHKKAASLDCDWRQSSASPTSTRRPATVPPACAAEEQTAGLAVSSAASVTTPAEPATLADAPAGLGKDTADPPVQFPPATPPRPGVLPLPASRTVSSPASFVSVSAFASSISLSSPFSLVGQSRHSFSNSDRQAGQQAIATLNGAAHPSQTQPAAEAKRPRPISIPQTGWSSSLQALRVRTTSTRRVRPLTDSATPSSSSNLFHPTSRSRTATAEHTQVVHPAGLAAAAAPSTKVRAARAALNIYHEFFASSAPCQVNVSFELLKELEASMGALLGKATTAPSPPQAALPFGGGGESATSTPGKGNSQRHLGLSADGLAGDTLTRRAISHEAGQKVRPLFNLLSWSPPHSLSALHFDELPSSERLLTLFDKCEEEIVTLLNNDSFFRFRALWEQEETDKWDFPMPDTTEHESHGQNLKVVVPSQPVTPHASDRELVATSGTHVGTGDSPTDSLNKVASRAGQIIGNSDSPASRLNDLARGGGHSGSGESPASSLNKVGSSGGHFGNGESPVSSISLNDSQGRNTNRLADKRLAGLTHAAADSLPEVLNLPEALSFQYTDEAHQA
eukprot:g52004.t1